MAQSLSEEEFARIQEQIIDLRTKNYELEAASQRHLTELKEVQDKLVNHEKELQKANKIINKSKSKKEYAILLEENESFQNQFQAQEENFKLQNQTLLEEIIKLNQDNSALQKENERLQSSESSEPGDNAEIRRLRAESAALQKSLANAQEKHHQELAELQQKIRSSSFLKEPAASEEQTNGKAVSQHEQPSSQYKTVSQVRQILQGELDEFRELVLQSMETDRSEVRGNDDSRGNELNSGAEPLVDHEGDIQDAKDKDGRVVITEQVDVLRGKLEDMLVPLLSLSSSSGSIVEEQNSGMVTSELLLEAETKCFALESHIKEMSSLQLRLDTEHEEKRLLQEQFKQAEETSKDEINQLKDEIAKLSDKIKKKQESYLQLQDEKEKLYSENKKAVEDIKSKKENEIRILSEQLTKLQEEMGIANQRYFELQEDSSVTIKDLQNSLVNYQSQVSTSAEVTEQVVQQLRQEKQALAKEFEAAKEKLLISGQEAEETVDLISKLEERLQHSETSTAQLTIETEELREQLKEQHSAVDGWNTQIQQLTDERDNLAQQYEEAAKIAEKRKSMLDQIAIERQEIETAHREAVERIQEEHRKSISELREQITGEKKLRKEVEDLHQKLNENKSLLQSVESKSGWFERRLAETEETLKAEQEQHSQALESCKKEHEQQIAALNEERDSLEEELNGEKTSLHEMIENQSSEMSKLRQELKDKEVETRIASKKGDQLVKDLKRQFKLERKRADQLQQKLQEALSENRAKQSFDEMFNASGGYPRRNSGDSSILSHNRSDLESPDYRPPSPSSSTAGLLNEDTLELIERLADVQQEKWLLEEKVRHLEETGGALADDLVQKSEVIQAYAMETKIGAIRGSPKQDALSSIKEKVKVTLPFGKSKMETKKIQLMLEETLMKNLQLQKDIDNLSKELESYRRLDYAGSKAQAQINNTPCNASAKPQETAGSTSAQAQTDVTTAHAEETCSVHEPADEGKTRTEGLDDSR
ncbi:GRIP1-associated protein 1 [Nematostella vectensis]|uniref:GRIP1-associated protein 1 n=1 Tax=Nematostella vectensis TaxID=45351 RepID=UPI0020776315|nr:GRIP1-associated protein 1 [Nematostella vectensis]